MKFKEILSLVCGLNGELSRKGEYLLHETIGKVGSADMVQRVTGWCNLAKEYGEHEVSEIMPLDHLKLRVTIK